MTLTLLEYSPGFRKLSPILKWAGGKRHELKYITPSLPAVIERYFEPFVGGGAVYTSIQAHRYSINDKSVELISLYRCLAGPDRDTFFKAAKEIARDWTLIGEIVKSDANLLIDIYRTFANDSAGEAELKPAVSGFIDNRSPEFVDMLSKTFNFDTRNLIQQLQTNMDRKFKRMKHLEKVKRILPDIDVLDNIETSLKSALYMYFRHVYNNARTFDVPLPIRSAIFFFIRNFAYSGMFRYNAAGHFNVPYGGIGYNCKDLNKNIHYLKSAELYDLLIRTDIQNLDFEQFLRKNEPGPNDFVFLDPPYDTEFSTYAQNEFTHSDQTRLAQYLIEDCGSKWMLIIKNTELIRSLYFGKSLNVMPFDKTYLVSFMNRNDKSAEHLLIRNYTV